MGIPPRQIGWSQESNLLWEISKTLDSIYGKVGGLQGTITLTTTGNSGPATLINNVLNVPEYTLEGLGGVPLTRTITINGDTQSLATDVAFTVLGSPISVVTNYSALPPPATVSGSFYWAENSQGSQWIPGIFGGTYYNSGLYYSNGVKWEYMETPYQAVQAEVDAGVLFTKFVTPLTFANASKWTTKQDTLILTTTGTSGPATLVGSTLNIPQYTGGSGGGGVQTIVPGTNIAVNSSDPANPIVSAIPATSAGVFDRVYLTGQVASIATPIGPNYDSIRNGKGSVALVSLVAGGLTESTKVYLPNDIVGPAYPIANILPLGNYTGFLSVQASAAISLKRFTIEVFLCDNAGNIISSTGPASGSTDPFYAGKNTITILDSGDINLGNGTVTQVGLSGYLANNISVAIGQRFRFHISVARGTGGGGTQTMTIFTGSNANSYVEAPVPITTSTVVNVSNVPGSTATDALNALTQWKGNWVAGTYQKNQQVLDNSFLAIANKVTSDRPSPQPIGQPGYVYAAPTISTTSVSAKQVIFGNRYQFNKDVILEAWRVNVIAGNAYSIYLVEDPLGTFIISQIINYTAQKSGWIALNVPKTIIKSGSTYDLVSTVSQPATTPVTFTANYNYKKPTNSTVPNAGDITQANNLATTLRINKTDNNAIDRTAQLAALGIGDKITGDNTIWAIQSKTDDGTYFSFVVSPATQLASLGVKTFIFESVATTPITYPLSSNYWSTNPPVGIIAQGLLSIDASYFTIVPNTTAYGVDILVQEIIPSPDWDIQAFSEIGGSSGGEITLQSVYDASTPPQITTSSSANPIIFKGSTTGNNPILQFKDSANTVIMSFNANGKAVAGTFVTAAGAVPTNILRADGTFLKRLTLIQVASYALPSSATAIDAFGNGSPNSVNVIAGEWYEFIWTAIYTTLNATSGAFSVSFAGTATGGIMLNASASKSSTLSTPSAASVQTYYQGSSIAGPYIITSATTGFAVAFDCRGTMRITGTGTLIPQVTCIGFNTGTGSLGLNDGIFVMTKIN